MTKAELNEILIQAVSASDAFGDGLRQLLESDDMSSASVKADLLAASSALLELDNLVRSVLSRILKEGWEG